MQVTKAVITAAGNSRTQLPLQSVVDRSGQVRTALELLVDELTAAEISHLAIVVRPGQSEAYEAAAGDSVRIQCIEQDSPIGYGDAILRAEEFVGEDAFLHLVSDHLYVSRNTKTCAQQLIEVAQEEGCSVSAVQPTRENELAYFGAIGGSPVPRSSSLFEVKQVVEKPTPTQAEQSLIVAGQRAGYYLCLFGMHVLTPKIFELLRADLAAADGTIDLSTSLNRLAQNERYLAAKLDGVRYDIGEKYGLLIAQLAIALSGDDRERILSELVELVARQQSPQI